MPACLDFTHRTTSASHLRPPSARRCARHAKKHWSATRTRRVGEHTSTMVARATDFWLFPILMLLPKQAPFPPQTNRSLRACRVLLLRPLQEWRKWRSMQALQRSEEHTSELQSLRHLVCRLLLEKK